MVESVREGDGEGVVLRGLVRRSCKSMRSHERWLGGRTYEDVWILYPVPHQANPIFMVVFCTLQQLEYLLECCIELIDHFLLDFRTYGSAEKSRVARKSTYRSHPHHRTLGSLARARSGGQS